MLISVKAASIFISCRHLVCETHFFVDDRKKGQMTMKAKAKITNFIQRIGAKLQLATTTMTAIGMAGMMSTVAASTLDVKGTVITPVTTLLGIGIAIFGGVKALMGIASFFSAKDDDNGPGMKKARDTIISGVIIAAFGVAIATILSQLLSAAIDAASSVGG